MKVKFVEIIPQQFDGNRWDCWLIAIHQICLKWVKIIKQIKQEGGQGCCDKLLFWSLGTLFKDRLPRLQLIVTVTPGFANKNKQLNTLIIHYQCAD